jgi:predicted dehydrogenase
MGFGAAFVPIYKHHPDVEYVGIVEPNRGRREAVARRFDLPRTHADLPDALAGDQYDAVHLVSPIPLHARQSLAVLNAGKHCACTVPMATSLKDVKAIIAAQRRSGRNYMMMETAVYTRQFLYLRELASSGKIGRIQFLRGAHYQDMERWPAYWLGLPPMHYATHAVSPCLAIAGARAVRVRCLGSGVMRKSLHRQYGNPFPIESALFELDRPGLAMEVTRSLFHTARSYTESFAVYGEKMSLEWPQIEEEDRPVVFRMLPANPAWRGRPVQWERLEAPDRADLLPPEIARFTVRGRYEDTNPQKTFEVGGGHHGSHPHLVHEFVRSIAEGRKPWIDEVAAANWTAAGICAHLSAMRGGKAVTVPEFGLSKR